MKTLIATAAVALSLSATAFAQVSDAQVFFALGNDSAAERVVGQTSQGDIFAAQEVGALSNESAAERQVYSEAGIATRNANILSFFALGNDSAAERLVK